MNGQEADDREPSAPHDHLIQILQVEHAEHKNEFEENKIPKMIFYMLVNKAKNIIKIRSKTLMYSF